MRTFCLLFLVAFTAAVALFAYSNQSETTLRFLQWEFTTSLAVIAGVAYLLGMFSGWTIVGMLRRSTNRVVESVEQGYAQS